VITEFDVLLDTIAEVLKIISAALKKKYFVYFYCVILIDHIITYPAGCMYRNECILQKDFRVPLQKRQDHSPWSQRYV